MINFEGDYTPYYFASVFRQMPEKMLLVHLQFFLRVQCNWSELVGCFFVFLIELCNLLQDEHLHYLQ